jgi:hypothetical protein
MKQWQKTSVLRCSQIFTFHNYSSQHFYEHNEFYTKIPLEVLQKELQGSYEFHCTVLYLEFGYIALNDE